MPAARYDALDDVPPDGGVGQPRSPFEEAPPCLRWSAPLPWSVLRARDRSLHPGGRSAPSRMAARSAGMGIGLKAETRKRPVLPRGFGLSSTWGPPARCGGSWPPTSDVAVRHASTSIFRWQRVGPGPGLRWDVGAFGGAAQAASLSHAACAAAGSASKLARTPLACPDSSRAALVAIGIVDQQHETSWVGRAYEPDGDQTTRSGTRTTPEAYSRPGRSPAGSLGGSRRWPWSGRAR